jgi:phytoene/squalene synthetase
MLMSEDQLRKDLEALRAESDRLEGMAGPARERVQRLIADVERRLERVEDAGQDESLLERLREELAEFEVEHPTVAAAIETMLNTLSNAGI